MKKTSDIALLSRVISFYSISGTIPSISKKPPILPSIFAIFSLGSGLVVIKIFLIEKIEGLKFTATNALLYSGTSLTIILFNFICFGNVWFHSGVWRDIFDLINKFDLAMEGYRTQMEKYTIIYYIKIITFSVGNVSLFVYILCSSNENFFIYEKVICYIYALFANMQIFASTFILWELLSMICKRYQFVEEKLKETYQSPKSSDIFWNKDQFKITVSLLSKMVTDINEFFGLRILLIIIMVFFNVLNVYQYIFLYFPQSEQESFLHKSAIILETSWLLVSIYLLIILVVMAKLYIKT